MIRLTEIICHQWYRVWLGMSFPAGAVGNVFVWLQRLHAAFHILSNIMSHARPPVVACYQFGHLPPSQMSSYWGVMVDLYNVMLQLSVQWNIVSSK